MSSVAQDSLASAMWRLLEITEDDMNAKFPEPTTLNGVAKPVTRSTSKYQQYFDTLNHISYAIHRVVDTVSIHSAADPIQFFHCRNIVLEVHPSGTVNRPDFLAQRATRGKKTSVFHWSTLEATGELFPGKKRKKQEREDIYETAFYTSHLLEARPDRLAVQGMCIEPGGFKLNLSNACGSFYTEVLDWESRRSRLLLAAWIWRLYHPFVDPSITTKFKLNKAPKYTIHCPDELYDDCEILSVGSGFGRRTVVFKTAKPNTIIKEQYIRPSIKSNETEILSKIHSKGSFPGVVRLGWNGPVTLNQQELVVKWEDEDELHERKKMRMVLLDEGGSLMDVETLRDALIAMYDLLEITRILHTHRKIFHRDISSGNILLRKTFPRAGAKQPLPATDLKSMCFASHLLNEKSASSSAGRLDTKVLLVDFDRSEDQEEGGDGARTGTHTFMAREVRSGKHQQSDILFPMPQLNAGNTVYDRVVGDRLKSFPPNEMEWDFDDKHREGVIEPFNHQLRYDAESVFWLLFWWALQAQPDGEGFTEGSSIDGTTWLFLTSNSNRRLCPSFDLGEFHPFYKPLHDLFTLLVKQLSGHPEESKEPSRRKDEYLHEALQRIIFGFLFDHYDDSFMTAKKNPKSRTVAPLELYYGFGSRHSTGSSGGDTDGDDGEDVGHDKKRRRIN